MSHKVIAELAKSLSAHRVDLWLTTFWLSKKSRRAKKFAEVCSSSISKDGSSHGQISGTPLLLEICPKVKKNECDKAETLTVCLNISRLVCCSISTLQGVKKVLFLGQEKFSVPIRISKFPWDLNAFSCMKSTSF